MSIKQQIIFSQKEKTRDSKESGVCLQAAGDECYLSLPTIECLTPFHKASVVLAGVVLL